MRVYSAPVLAQVTHIKHVLETHGIECHLQGEYQRRGTEPRATPCRFFRSTYARHRIRHGIRHTEVLAGRVPPT